MTNDNPNDKEVRIPRRGAIPSPKSEIEKAPSFDPTKVDKDQDKKIKENGKEDSDESDMSNR